MVTKCVHRPERLCLFQLIDTVRRLRPPVAIMAVVEAMFGLTDVFVADQDAANHKGAARIWGRRHRTDSRTMRGPRPQ